MDIKIIKSPGKGTVDMLNRRRSVAVHNTEFPENYDAIGLVQGKLIEMLVAADFAEKTADVQVEEIRGLCPQHFTLLAIYGDTASVEAAIKAIKEGLS